MEATGIEHLWDFKGYSFFSDKSCSILKKKCIKRFFKQKLLQTSKKYFYEYLFALHQVQHIFCKRFAKFKTGCMSTADVEPSGRLKEDFTDENVKNSTK